MPERTYAGEGMFLDPGSLTRETTSSQSLRTSPSATTSTVSVRLCEVSWQQCGLLGDALKRYYAETGAKGKPLRERSKWLQWRRDQC